MNIVININDYNNIILMIYGAVYVINSSKIKRIDKIDNIND